jgi:hypothetical protein
MMAEDMSDKIVVKQSTETASKYEATVEGYPLIFAFLKSSKNRMDFMVEHDNKPHGTYNLLSQHSINRLAKSLDIADSAKNAFNVGVLTVGTMLRDGEYEPAPIVDRRVAEVETYAGKMSSRGVIDANIIEDFLGDQHLLDVVNEVLHGSRGVPFVGDDANLLLTFLVMLSCKTDSPLNLEMVGQSSSGKTYLTLTARNGFPKSMCMVLAGASREALKYDYDEIDEEGNFIVHVEGRCIIILEKDESEAFIRKMKPLMSGDDKELVWKTPIKNDLTGEIETRDFIIKGQPSFITLTTRNPREAEQITRQLLMTPDTTTEKVAAVVSNSLNAKARPDEMLVHPDVELLQASMLNLKQYRVRNIFAPLMVDFFPARNAQHQRDINKVLSIIDAVTLLHQKQRPIHQHNDREYLMSSIEDNIIGLILCDLVLRASLSGIPDDSWIVFSELQSMEDAKRPLTEDNILQWLNIHAFSCSKNALREKHLPTLEDAGLIELARRGGGRGGGRKTWRIVKTRQGLLETYALAPLFVESARNNLQTVIDEFQPVIDGCIPPKRSRRLDRGEKELLQTLGCGSKTGSLIYRSLFLGTYLNHTGRNGVLFDIVGDVPARDALFSRTPAWLDTTLKSTATETLGKKREAREKVKEATKIAAVGENADDLWNALADAHLFDEPSL